METRNPTWIRDLTDTGQHKNPQWIVFLILAKGEHWRSASRIANSESRGTQKHVALRKPIQRWQIEGKASRCFPHPGAVEHGAKPSVRARGRIYADPSPSACAMPAMEQ